MSEDLLLWEMEKLLLESIVACCLSCVVVASLH